MKSNCFKLPEKGVLLHASSVLIHNKALLFLGHSGSGKSTIARLLSSEFSHLSDDKVLWCDGSVKNGDTTNLSQSLQSNTVYPLLGCVRIFKNRDLSISKMNPIETTRILLDSVMEIDVQRKVGRELLIAENQKKELSKIRNIRKRWFNEVAEISRSYPGWKLDFRKNVSEEKISSILLKAIQDYDRVNHSNDCC